MPNHVINRISGKKEILDRIVDDDGRVDFSLIIPMPEGISLDGVSIRVEKLAKIALGLLNFNAMSDEDPATLEDMVSRLEVSNAIRTLARGQMAKDLSGKDFEAFVEYMRNYRKYGSLHWVDWAEKHWGTESNAYDAHRIDDTTLEFQTAGSAPHPVIEGLAQLAASDLLHEWADGDTGSNVGYRMYSGGTVSVEKELSNTRGGYELCFKLHPEKAQYYRLEGDSYVYVDVDEE